MKKEEEVESNSFARSLFRIRRRVFWWSVGGGESTNRSRSGRRRRRNSGSGDSNTRRVADLASSLAYKFVLFSAVVSAVRVQSAKSAIRVFGISLLATLMTRWWWFRACNNPATQADNGHVQVDQVVLVTAKKCDSKCAKGGKCCTKKCSGATATTTVPEDSHQCEFRLVLLYPFVFVVEGFGWLRCFGKCPWPPGSLCVELKFIRIVAHLFYLSIKSWGRETATEEQFLRIVLNRCSNCGLEIHYWF